jgi:pimeloyl-ACP methyl ester carboxylesterase
MPIAKVNGINVSYGIRGKGEPLILISGYSSDQSGWVFQTGAFKKYYRVITFDNRGVGKSDKPSGAYSMKTMADDTVGLMDYLGIKKAHVLGISSGGLIAQALAINYPERINKLVLASTDLGRGDSSGISLAWLKALGLGEDATLDDLRRIPIIKRGDSVYPLAFNRPLFRIIFPPLAKIKARLSGTAGLHGQWEAFWGYNNLKDLPEVKAPTLVLVGAEDRLIKSNSSEIIAKLIPNAKLVKVKGASHAFNVEMSGRFNKEVLDFLKA